MEAALLHPSNALLDAAEQVVVQRGIANMTLEAVAAEAGMSKGGLLHHFHTKDRLVEAMVLRHAQGWRNCYMEGYASVPEGPGRMARGLLKRCLADANCWTEQLRRSTSAVFAALAQNPTLIEPMRTAYAELHQRLLDDGLPYGVADAVVTAIDGLWLYWVLGLVPVNQERMDRLRCGLETLLAPFVPVATEEPKPASTGKAPAQH
jgi:AcrR family transcriptional regulator